MLILFAGEVFLQSGADSSRDTSQVNVAKLIKVASTKAPANVQERHVEAESVAHVKDFSGKQDCCCEGMRVGCSTADMEGDSNHVEAEVFGAAEKGQSINRVCAELVAELATGLGVICSDAQDQVAGGVPPGHFVELRLGVEGCEVDVVGGSVSDLAGRLAGVSIDDTVWTDTKAGDSSDLLLAGTVESSADGCQDAHDGRVGVAFDGIEWLDSRHSLAPGLVQANDCPKIHDIEAVLQAMLLYESLSVCFNGCC